MQNAIISRPLLKLLLSSFPCDLPLHHGVEVTDVVRLQGQDEIIRFLTQRYLMEQNIKANTQQLINEIKAEISQEVNHR